ncbi:hypothetical protein [Myxococcus sp. AB036A]|uniref:hypothetical protein n=1 Tax=Myxococcus sp. AB036A TaxID=2562793 RepID=UPI001146194D|nr:hypothetical protein [Myxococcus sp. AB036A]
MRLHGALMGLTLMCAGCATLSRGFGATANEDTGEYETPAEELVYIVPAEDAMMVARRILEEQRYDVMEKEGGLEMFSSAHEPGKNMPGLRTIERYYIKGERLGPRQTVVRVFRLSYNEMDTQLEIPPQVAGKREAAMFAALDAHPFDATRDAFTYANGPNGPRAVPMEDPFKNAPGMERMRMVRGVRDLDIERTLLQRLEMVPALELVGSNAPVPIRSVTPEGGQTEQAQQAPECGTPVDGAGPLMAPGHVLLLADPLGTRELPAAALRMLCEATAQGLPVTLALSLPASEQPLLETYLASPGQHQDLQTMMSESPFWRRTYQDGRSSSAMLWLIEQARRLRAAGKDISVVAFDAEKAQGNEREAEMARHLLAHQQTRAQAWTLVLAGGTHVRTAGVNWDSDYAPLGARLAQVLPSVRALDVGFTRGTQFSCRFNVWDAVECNVFAISPTKEVRQKPDITSGVRLFPQPLAEGFHGRLYVGALSASPPALHRLAPTTAAQTPPATSP